METAKLLANSPEEDYEIDRLLRTTEITDSLLTDTAGVSLGDLLIIAFAAWHDPETQEWLGSPSPLLSKAQKVPMDIPAWWRMKKKSAMFANMAIGGDWSVWALNEAYGCVDSVGEVERVHEMGPDIRAYLQTLEPPPYPKPLDAALVAEGKGIFEATCSRCHGTYGEDWTYPSVVVPLDVIGTDPAMANMDGLWNEAWDKLLEPSPWSDGGRVHWHAYNGYVAPPLDGVWITGPYLHNGSVPTVEAVLDSKRRPTYWRRKIEAHDTKYFDFQALGWQVDELDHGKAGAATAEEALYIYDTTQPYYDNHGHTFGDALTDAQRKAVIEYLKTL